MTRSGAGKLVMSVPWPLCRGMCVDVGEGAWKMKPRAGGGVVWVWMGLCMYVNGQNTIMHA